MPSLYINQQILHLIETFDDLFKFITAILLFAGIFMICYIGYNSVKNKTEEIGILKALGIRNKDLYRIYWINSFITMFLCIVFYFVLVYLFKYLANEILLTSIENYLLMKFNYVIFNLTLKEVGFDLLVILVSLFISVFIPIIRIKNIVPLKIIRNKY